MQIKASAQSNTLRHCPSLCDFHIQNARDRDFQRPHNGRLRNYLIHYALHQNATLNVNIMYLVHESTVLVDFSTIIWYFEPIFAKIEITVHTDKKYNQMSSRQKGD